MTPAERHEIDTRLTQIAQFAELFVPYDAITYKAMVELAAEMRIVLEVPEHIDFTPEDVRDPQVQAVRKGLYDKEPN